MKILWLGLMMLCVNVELDVMMTILHITHLSFSLLYLSFEISIPFSLMHMMCYVCCWYVVDGMDVAVKCRNRVYIISNFFLLLIF